MTLDCDGDLSNLIIVLKEILEEQRRIRYILQDNTDAKVDAFKTTMDNRNVSGYHIRY